MKARIPPVPQAFLKKKRKKMIQGVSFTLLNGSYQQIPGKKKSMEELKDIVIRAQQGAISAFEELVGRFKDMACGYACSMLRDYHYAEDVTQDAFLDAYQHLGDLRDPAAFPGWFRRILFKHCDRYNRKNTEVPMELDKANAMPDDRNTPLEATQKKEVSERIMEEIRALPETQRTVTTLFYINGYSQSEVAEFLDVPVTTVKKRLHSSRKRLKKGMMDMVEKTLKENRFSKDYEGRLLQKMKKTGVWGEWLDEGNERLGKFKGGPWTTLVTPMSWPGDAVVATFSARGEKSSHWGLGWEASFTTCPSVEALQKSEGKHNKFALKCGYRERYLWSNIHYNHYKNATWSRTIGEYIRHSAFNGLEGKWYDVRVERLGKRLRHWVNGVLIEEINETADIPKEVFFMLFSICSDCRFKDVHVYRPDENEIEEMKKSQPVFNPFELRQEILRKYEPETTHLAKITYSADVDRDGLIELAFPFKRDRTDDSTLSYSIAEENVNGRPCHRTNLSIKQEGFSLKLSEPEKLNNMNDHFLEIDYLDNAKGSLVAFYSSWGDKVSTTEDWPLTGTGEWKTARFFLRDVRFKALENEEYHIWPFIVRSEGEDLHVSEIRLIERKFPVKAHEEVIAAYDRKIKENADNWSIAHYMLHKALVLHQNLNKPQEATAILEKVREKYPDSECIPMYERMIATL